MKLKNKKRAKKLGKTLLAASLILAVSPFNLYADINDSGYSLDYDEDLPWENEGFENLASASNALMLRAISAANVATVTLDDSKTTANIKAEIEAALSTNDIVVVTGNHNDFHDAYLDIPTAKKVIWKADVESGALIGNHILRVSGSGTASFEVAGGKFKDTTNDNVGSVLEFGGSLDVNISGGEISSTSDDEVNLVFTNEAGVRISMSGGKIIADKGNKTGIHSNSEVRVNGGEIYVGSEDRGSGNYDYGKGVYVGGSGARAGISGGLIFGEGSVENLVKAEGGASKDISGGAVIAFKRHSLPTRTHYIKKSSTNMEISPSFVKAYWDNEHSSADIVYKSGDLSGHIKVGDIYVDGEISGYTLPSSTVYDALPHGISGSPEIQTTVSGNKGDVNIKYRKGGVEQAGLPTDAGNYEVYAEVQNSDIYANEEFKLSEFEISRRPIKVVAENKSMTAGGVLPVFTYRIENLAEGQTMEDALAATFNLTANTDGKTAGEYDIVLTSALQYKDNYKADAAAGFVKAKLSVAAAGSITPPNPGTTTPGGTPPSTTTPGGTTPGITTPGGTTPGTVTPGGGNNTPGGGSNAPSSSSGSSGSSGGGGGSSRRRTIPKTQNKASGSWISDAKGWWYKNADGSWAKNAWMQIEYNGRKDWYYFNAEGYMTTGWQMINGKWYYLYENSENGNIKGSLAVSTVINGYNVNADGEWIQ